MSNEFLFAGGNAYKRKINQHKIDSYIHRHHLEGKIKELKERRIEQLKEEIEENKERVKELKPDHKIHISKIFKIFGGKKKK
jgi:hypothetical protein